MNIRRLYLDDAPGERRGVVTLNGLPERLLLERHDDIPIQQPRARAVARVRRIERALASAFLDLGAGPDAVLSLAGAASGIAEGAWIEIEITAPARRGKGAVARLVGSSDGPIRLLAAAPGPKDRLQGFAEDAVIVTGAPAREAADIAADAALAVEHPLPGGGRLFIEPTQALTAVDVDLASAGGDSRKAAMRANREAIVAAARLLRLKGLGGLVVIDLAGKGHDGAALSVLAKAAFAPDGDSVSIGPISRFGLFELALPRTATPIAERLLDADGRPSARAMALKLLRTVEDAAGPGQIIQAVCAIEVAAAAEPLAAQLKDRIGPRFAIHADASKGRTDMEVTAR